MTEPVVSNKIRVKTARFGDIEIPEDRVVTIPFGMVGFPDQRRFVLIQHGEASPFYWLQSLERPELAFVVVSPLLFDPAYNVALGDSETKLLKVSQPETLQIWVVVTIPHGKPNDMTANLRAPLVLNLENRLGAQIILDDTSYPLKTPLKNN